ncbi:two component transcriptional regulator, LuxR family [Quadrisphaera granulorum]|uniref:LuxR family two component transcriptional regulator n=1 Tax=Quadrisphaera granulorum TaxID=317664 RepID=A0A316A7T9_9ACTN|nr:response regulator transcription factor [Quadrisphaera granulorum]PWJ53040.1 LuxR family two component transcriptional regulator [Quadrisphaera granulorum]SZE97205.1 two component transcriptional regulator, LuxR family [Quadrisphaera granulorum]
MNEVVRVAVVDDHTAFREGVEAVLSGRGGVTIVGSYGTAEAALPGLAADPADVVLMDLGLPGIDGIEATRRVLAAFPGTRVLVLSMLDDTASVRDAIDAGASGYLAKTAGLDEILRGIHAVHAGQLLLGSSVARHLSGPRPAPEHGGWTPRELQVLALLADAATTGQIAERLGITQKTVRNVLSSIYPRLGVEDRGQAVLAARRVLGR